MGRGPLSLRILEIYVSTLYYPEVVEINETVIARTGDTLARYSDLPITAFKTDRSAQLDTREPCWAKDARSRCQLPLGCSKLPNPEYP